jgi:lysozyme|tara:strand:- start:642 stop:1046 length:405 start_codon:yes stop_codon:yes gene_type:complete
MEDIREQLIRHEGLRLTVYDCPAGYKTIGVGRNLEGKGITEKEALYLLDNDIADVSTSLEDDFSWFGSLDEGRKSVLINMAFNLGLAGLKKFKNMLGAVEQSNWEEASIQMLDSKWASQVGNRAVELSEIMKNG